MVGILVESRVFRCFAVCTNIVIMIAGANTVFCLMIFTCTDTTCWFLSFTVTDIVTKFLTVIATFNKEMIMHLARLKTYVKSVANIFNELPDIVTYTDICLKFIILVLFPGIQNTKSTTFINK